MLKRLGILSLTIACPLALLALVFDSAAGRVFFALYSVLTPLALVALAARGHTPRLARWLLMLAFVLGGSAVGLLMRPPGMTPLLLLLVGLFILPLVIVVVAFARGFDEEFLPRETLEDLLRRAGSDERL